MSHQIFLQNKPTLKEYFASICSCWGNLICLIDCYSCSFVAFCLINLVTWFWVIDHAHAYTIILFSCLCETRFLVRIPKTKTSKANYRKFKCRKVKVSAFLRFPMFRAFFVQYAYLSRSLFRVLANIRYSNAQNASSSRIEGLEARPIVPRSILWKLPVCKLIASYPTKTRELYTWSENSGSSVRKRTHWDTILYLLPS